MNDNCFIQLNGALTIGTLDGANVEMAEEMGLDNIFIFGMTVDEVEDLKRRGYNAYDYYNRNPEIKQCVDQIQNGFFSPGNPDEFRDVADVLLKYDRFFLLADFEAYIKSQEKVGEVYQVCANALKYTILETLQCEIFINQLSDYFPYLLVLPQWPFKSQLATIVPLNDTKSA